MVTEIVELNLHKKVLYIMRHFDQNYHLQRPPSVRKDDRRVGSIKFLGSFWMSLRGKVNNSTVHSIGILHDSC